MFEYGVIYLDIPIKEFYKLTFYEYRCLINRHTIQYHNQWAHTRFLSFTAVRMMSKENIAIEDYMPLLIDGKKEEVPEITQERREELMKIAMDRAAIFNKNK